VPEAKQEQLKDMKKSVLLLFDTTHAAMEAEENIIADGFWCDVVPRPPGASETLCGLAIEVEEKDMEEITAILLGSGIPVEIYHGGVSDEH
jgi:hypothetical protein